MDLQQTQNHHQDDQPDLDPEPDLLVFKIKTKKDRSQEQSEHQSEQNLAPGPDAELFFGRFHAAARTACEL